MRSLSSLLGTALIGLSFIAAPVAAQQAAPRAPGAAAQRPQPRSARLALQGHRLARQGRATERMAAVQRHRARALRATGHPRAARAARRDALRTQVRGAAEVRRGRLQQQRAMRLHRQTHRAAPAI